MNVQSIYLVTDAVPPRFCLCGFDGSIVEGESLGVGVVGHRPAHAVDDGEVLAVGRGHLCAGNLEVVDGGRINGHPVGHVISVGILEEVFGIDRLPHGVLRAGDAASFEGGFCLQMDDAALGITFEAQVTIVELIGATIQSIITGGDFETAVLHEDTSSIINAISVSRFCCSTG